MMGKRKQTDKQQAGLGDPLFGTRLGETAKMSEEPVPAPEMKREGADVFIVDNSDSEWKVRSYLREWTDIASRFDIATGYFEVGALLAMEGKWQQLEKIRILMGDEVSYRTRAALLEGIKSVVKRKLDESIESEKERNDFLVGVPAIVQALQSRQIDCRVYAKEKFHAKAYITHGKHAVVGSVALVGSSNFTLPGITNNVELNVQIRREVDLLQKWFEAHWDKADDVTLDILKVIERHTRDYSPFDVYAKALQELFYKHEKSAAEWERSESKMFPILDFYQKEGYWSLVDIGSKWGGAFLCDGVGLGKTFVGLMLIERLISHERKRVALIVPKTGREPVWEANLKKYLPGLSGDFSNLVILNHTDLDRGGEYPERLERIKELADVVLIDEAHHFRNPGFRGSGSILSSDGGSTEKRSRYWHLFDACKGKTVYLLTATPINNHLIDLQHMIELFSQREDAFFGRAPLGIHSLRGHFRKMEKDLEKSVLGAQLALSADKAGMETNDSEAMRVLSNDAIFNALVVQRSRAYVKKSQDQHGGREAIFAKKEPPIVANYSLKKTYGGLLAKVEKAFHKDKPLFSLAVYYPLAYYKGADSSIDPVVENRQRQVIQLIRSQFLKRFESSARAFELSCQTLLIKLVAWVTKNSETVTEKRWLDRWQSIHSEILEYVKKEQALYSGAEADPDEDFIPEEMLEDIEVLSRDEYRVDEILSETHLDLDELVDFIKDLRKLKTEDDDKLKTLVKLLNADSRLKGQKALIFTEFMATARYLADELRKRGVDGIDEIDSASGRNRGEVIKRFAPYYNESSSQGLKEAGLTETRILISTDVLSEGLNLQDASRLINYDIHWNPVRLMQRVGRVDRRLNPKIEQAILTHHPETKDVREKVFYWNFLPPDEIDNLLNLYGTVAQKTLKISKTFGIEGRKLFKPDDDYEALRDFLHTYEGETSPIENLSLEFQRLLKEIPGLEDRLAGLPRRLFSGKKHPDQGSKGIFFCYRLPAQEKPGDGQPETGEWTESAGIAQWYYYDFYSEKVLDDAATIAKWVRSQPGTERKIALDKNALADAKAKVEKEIRNGYLKRVQAPAGVKPVLKAWMELS